MTVVVGSKEIRWSTILDYDARTHRVPNTFNVLSDGTLPSANTQKYFYIFVPYYSKLRPDISLSEFDYIKVNVGLGDSFIKADREDYYVEGVYKYYLDTDEVGSYEKYEYYGVIRYRINISENIYSFSREQNVEVTLTYGEAEETIGSVPVTGATRKEYTTRFTIVQDAKEDIPDPSVGTHIYYETFLSSSSNLEEEIEKSMIYYGLYIDRYPLKLQDKYSFRDSTDSNINSFRYINIATLNKKDAEFIVSSNVSWARLSLVKTKDNGRQFIYEVEVDENTENLARNAILEIILHGQTAIRIDIILYKSSSGDNPEQSELPNSIESVEDKYWEGAGTNTPVSIIDTNQGAAIDSTSLLFKSNFSNYYSTIELKDGTLFLGNYTSNKEINKVHKEMKKFVSSQVNIKGKEYRRKIYIDTTSSLDYSYVPNMKLDSQLKRIFKPGETYALGLVFIDTTGTWSSVYYLGDSIGKWEVDEELEPHLELDTNGYYYYYKPVKGVGLDETVTNTLSALGIIAVIPVYAIKTSNTIMCLGFLSPSLQSTSRQSEESILSQYSWFYRNFTSSLELLDAGEDVPVTNIEILNLHANRLGEEPNNWIINRLICSLNTPEVECDELLSEAMLLNVKCKSIWNYTNFTYNNNIIVQVSGKYIHSYFSAAHASTSNDVDIPIASIKNRRYISGYLWRGFVNNHYPKDDILSYTSTNTDDYYSWYAVYPWLRSTIGGEGPTSSITNKVLFNSLYNDGIPGSSTLTIPNGGDVDAAIYRNFDTASIIKVGSSIYQGNVDYISVTESDNAYKAMTSVANKVPKAYKDDGVYAGYDKDGNITDPISIKYKTAPHIVLNFLDGNVTFNNNVPTLFCVELYNPNITLKTETLDLQGYLWIKCGDIKRILPGKRTVVLYEEGDYFFGRYDSLRTYRYAENDVNSVVEVVSGMLCSKVNLDSRCDRNRGVTTPTISPTNFNIFNPVYNQLNNYFTFSYVNLDDLIYNRLYSNSIQWSLTKEYSSDIDNWCNILDINTLDFDGDKGQIRSIERLGNELIVFQDTAISLIQYNEKTLIATEQGIPIEIGNSGKVDGKHYLYDHVGCLYKGSISKSPNGIYFVDSINKSLYQLGINAKLTDLCTTIGMKSWGIANIDSSWWSYYDTNSQEVIFSNNVESLAFSDAYGKFNSFIGYGGIRWNFRGNDLTIQICPVNFKQVISTTTPTLSSNKRIPDITKELNNDSVTFWKKNSIDETKFFDNYSPIEILLQCNPEPTIDKIFSTVEYRMDCFDELNNYLENVTFDSFRAWNEYQDTALINLNYLEGNEDGPIYNRIYSTKLRKKFRIWRLDIPRASYKSISLLEGNNAVVSNESLTYNLDTGISIKTKNQPRDRIRNPWCNIYLSMDTSKADNKIKRIVFNDLAVQYFK